MLSVWIDILTTFVSISIFNANEVNPIFAWALGYGWSAAIVLKLLLGFGTPYIAKLIFPNKVRLLLLVLVAAALQLGISFVNLSQMAFFIMGAPNG